MDPMEPARKLLAKEKCKMRQILIKAFICAIFCSYPFWFPKLYSSANHFACLSLSPQHLKPFFVNPMCLFLIGNAIVVFLVGESKLAAGSSSSLTGTDTDDQEHVCKVEKNPQIEPEMGFGADDKAVNKTTVEDEDEEEYYSDDSVEDEESDGEEESASLATEELNKRVEDFIASVNRRRWLEAMLDDGGRG